MAELAVLNIAKSLLPQLSSYAKDELLLWYYSKDELKKLDNTITTIKAVLHDAEQKQATDSAVREWLFRLRDVMYEADELFDTISIRALRKRVIRGNKIVKSITLFFSESNHLVFTVTIAHKVKDLREHLADIAEDINRFGLIRRSTVEDARPSIKGKAPSHSYTKEDDVIGRDKEKREILSMLLADADDKERVSVIAVVGMGGMGKTALAQLLCNANEVEEYFDLRLWACVNYFSDSDEALEKIVASGTETNLIGLHQEQLQKMLRKMIHGQKFLLVLDDVWDHIRERWLPLKGLLDAGERGSKVLVTTRLKEVAKNLATVRPYYPLEELSDEYAWSLFKKMAFDCNQEEDIQDKETLGRQIMKKCPNVPLAIRTIGSFLCHKDKKQWSEFVNNELMKVVPTDQNMIMQMLKISYNDLPPPLKHCFAYCSLFPKDDLFDKRSLIRLWMAQGMLESGTSTINQCLEDIGEKYFSSLLERCFFQDHFGGDHYKMHDLFHDLAVEIAGEECLAMSNNLDDLRGRSPRHMAVGEITDSLFQVKGMRSLLCISSAGVGYLEKALLDGLFLHLTSLRALSLVKLDIEEIPSSIGKLVHLRYLDLSENEALIRLPAALCKLQNLLTLRLSGCQHLKKLPDDLHKLISLRHLETMGCRELDHMPMGLKKMTSLVDLDRLVVSRDHGGLRCLKLLNNLRSAICIELPGVQWKNCVADAEESMLKCKTKLSRTAIRWRHPIEGKEIMSELDADEVLDRLQPPSSIDDLGVYNFPGKKMPDWLSSLENLVELTLIGFSKCLELPHLRQLFRLKKLVLWSMPLLEFLEKDICYESSRSFFPSLETVHLAQLPRLKGWWKQAGEVGDAHLLSLTRLSGLRIFDCPEMTCLPLCPFVKSMDLRNVNVNLLKQLVPKAPKAELEGNSIVVPSSSAHQTFCRLESLDIWNIKDLAFLPEEFKHLSTLHKLSILDCPNLKLHSLFSSLQHLTALEGLCVVRSCLINENQENDVMPMPWISLTRLNHLYFEPGSNPQFLKGLHHLTMLEYLFIKNDVVYTNDLQWTAPPNLKFLNLIGMNEVTRLNRLIRQLKKLEELEISECKEVDELPWEDLISLRRLSFKGMRMMRSLPDKCGHLPMLKWLYVAGCHHLESLTVDYL